MDQEFPSNVQYTRSQSGLFAWITLPEEMDARDILQLCLARNLAFVPGESFFANVSQKNHFRINFSNMNEDCLVQGMHILADVLRQVISAQKKSHEEI